MITVFLYFLSFWAHSFPQELTSIYNRLTVHEFYRDNELITRPEDAWQVIASFSTVNSDLSLSKICFKYKPSKEPEGVFRVESMPLDEDCSKGGKKIYEQGSLYGIQFQREPDFKITFSHKDYSNNSWTIKTLVKKENLELLDTPDKSWGESVLFTNDDVGSKPLLADGTLCLKVRDDCTVEGESICHQCANGSLEAPNGCLTGPRYCSSFECGTKGNPACRRGVKFLKQRVLDCRRDNSFAFCGEDSIPMCQGAEVWCQ
ncbi:MAG TPA: hypothetical protein VKZ84_02900 [Bacteriovoracaceae bacterium]|nr:hypothetical protein [Bacteriovoracaceae bacterium]